MGAGALGPWLYAARIGAFSRRSSSVSRQYNKTCNRCKTSDLHWRETSKGFRLFTAEGKQHFCTDRPFIPSYADEYERPTFRGPEFEFDE